MIQAINDKFLALYAGLVSKAADLKDEERGQTSAEYIAVTAVAVLIAITVLYVAFQTSLNTAITKIGSELNSWIDGAFPS